jgi:hypothetical protein
MRLGGFAAARLGFNQLLIHPEHLYSFGWGGASHDVTSPRWLGGSGRRACVWEATERR